MVPNQALLNTSKSAPEWVTYGVKLGCKRAFRTLSPDPYIGFWWHLVTHLISGTEPSFVEYIEICLRLGVSWGENGMQKSTRSFISLSIHTIFQWNLVTCFISDIERRSIKPIKICGPIGCYCSWGEIGVESCTGYPSSYLYTGFEWVAFIFVRL